MAPLLITVLVAVGSAAATYLAVNVLHLRTDHEPPAGADHRGGSSPSAPSLTASIAVALAALATAGLVLGGLATGIERDTAIVRWDERVERWALESAGTLSTEVLRGITHLGDTVVVLSVALVSALVLLSMGRRLLGLFMVTVVVGQWALANLIKELVARARPDLDPLTVFSGYSFPSGHATAAAATYLALALVLVAVRPRWNASALLATGIGLAVAVATSRTMLGVHWFSDILGGLVLGWTWCVVCAWLFRVTGPRTVPRVTVG